jgi:very-short-patch-repair endonuclease
VDIDDLISGLGGAASRAELMPIIGRHALDNLVKSKQLVAVFPRAYARPWDADLVQVRRRAALKSVGGEHALSHLTTLAMHELPVPEDTPIHVTAFLQRHPRGVPGQLIVHRTQAPLRARVLDGFPIVGLETAIATSWPLLAGPDQRAPLIEAARRKLVSPTRLTKAVEAAFWIRGVQSLRELVSLVLAGCESELELWGYTGVFNVDGLADASRQVVVQVDGKTYRLDVAYEEELLNVELDGRAFHASPKQWERDIARDLAIAKLGWQTIRLPHARLFGDVDGCRRDVLAVRAVRRPLRRPA